MTKKELINELFVKSTGTTKAAIEKSLGDLALIVASELRVYGEITLPGIGKLHVDEVAARKGRNPQTGAEIDIPAKKRVKFKATKELADHVNL
jgi:DNA-binding protein HU-beta